VLGPGDKVDPEGSTACALLDLVVDEVGKFISCTLALWRLVNSGAFFPYGSPRSSSESRRSVDVQQQHINAQERQCDVTVKRKCKVRISARVCREIGKDAREISGQNASG
jgi:hypothetical protein